MTRSSSPSEDCERLCCWYIGPTTQDCVWCGTNTAEQKLILALRVLMREEKTLCKKASPQTFKCTGMSHLVECCSGTWERGGFSGLWQNPSCHRPLRALKLHRSISSVKQQQQQQNNKNTKRNQPNNNKHPNMFLFVGFFWFLVGWLLLFCFLFCFVFLADCCMQQLVPWPTH